MLSYLSYVNNSNIKKSKSRKKHYFWFKIWIKNEFLLYPNVLTVIKFKILFFFQVFFLLVCKICQL